MKRKKMISFLLALMMVCTLVYIPAGAYDSSDIYDSLNIYPSTDPDEFTSFKGNPTVSLSATSDYPSSGDCGAYFFYVNVGLDTDYVWSTSRTWTLRVMEADGAILGIGSADDPAVDYTGWFHVNSSGLYRLTGFTRVPILDDNNEPVIVEDTSGVELYAKVHVDMLYGDGDSTIEAGFFRYNLWVE